MQPGISKAGVGGQYQGTVKMILVISSPVHPRDLEKLGWKKKTVANRADISLSIKRAGVATPPIPL